LSDLRPISILPALSKCLETLLKNQIVGFVSSRSLLSPFQSGYREGHSTGSAVLRVVDDVASAMDKGHVSVLVLLDFSKAFDSVSHSRLCSKLQSFFSFSPGAVALVRSYLSGRSQRVSVSGVLSDCLSVRSGVPQGSVLGPVLFLLFINDICEALSSCKYHVFADDLQFYASARSSEFSGLVDLVNSNLRLVDQWASENGLLLNASKSKAMLVSRTPSVYRGVRLLLGGDTVQVEEKLTNLGFVLNERLTWCDLVSSVIGKVYGVLQSLRKSSYLPTDLKLRLFKSLILPFFNYSAVFLLSMSESSRCRLGVCLNNCVRFVYNLRLGQHVTGFQSSLLGVPFSRYFEYRSVIFVHKLLLTREPAYLYGKLRLSVNQPLRLIPSQNRTAHYNSSFFVRGVSLYNAVPLRIRRLTSMASFVRECREHFNS
jgi:hypothetical protein